MTNTFEIVDGTIRATLDLRSYRLSAIKKAAYRLADRCTIILGAPVSDQVDITIAFKSGTSEITMKEVNRAFFQELLDQELREIVAEETTPVRALILAQAFSKTNLIRHS